MVYISIEMGRYCVLDEIMTQYSGKKLVFCLVLFIMKENRRSVGKGDPYD